MKNNPRWTTVTLITFLVLVSLCLVLHWTERTGRIKKEEASHQPTIPKRTLPIAAAKPSGVKVHKNMDDAPGWSIPYGQEFWRRSEEASTGEPRVGGFNLGDVVERVACAVQADSSSAWPVVHSKMFTAYFDGLGLRFSPHRQSWRADRTPMLEPDPFTELVVRTHAIRLGPHILFPTQNATDSWSVVGNTAQAERNAEHGIVEHYQARNEGVELTWVFKNRPETLEDIQIETTVSGLVYAGEDENGHHFADGQGERRVRVSNVILVDATGTRVPLPLTIQGDMMHVQVPASVLEAAAFPVAIDPTISPEFSMGVTMASQSQFNPALASNGTNFLVVWSDNRNAPGNSQIYGTRVTSAGLVSDPSGIAISTAVGNDYYPAIASDGADYLVIWEDTRNGADIYGARVSSAGSVLDTNGIAVCTVTNNQQNPAVSCQGGTYLVVWGDDRDGNRNIYGARVTSSGTLQDSNSVAISTASSTQDNPEVAAQGTNYLVVWYDARDSRSDVYAARVTSTGSVLDGSGIVISTNSNNGSHRGVGSNGTNWLAAWNNSGDIWAARISAAGAVLDTPALTVSSASGQQTYPAVSGNGTDYFVVWQDGRGSTTNIYGSRVNSSGTVVDTNGIAVCLSDSPCRFPAVASLGSDYLVAWEDERNASIYGVDIYGARVSSAGSVLDLIALSTASAENNNQTFPAVASNGSDYLVVWEDDRNNASSSLDIYGTRVRHDGAVLDLQGIAICTVTNKQETPAAGSNGANYFVAWMDKRGTNYDIYGARINSDGALVDTNGFAISTATKDQLYPAIGSLAGDYLVAWQDYRGVYYDIYGSRVTSGGMVVDTNGIAIHTLEGAQRIPSVTGIGTNYFVVWFDQRPNDSSGYDVYGARVSTLGTVLETNGIAISTNSGAQYYSAAATDSSNYLVVWQDQRNGGAWDIYGARVDSAGTVLDTGGIAICTTNNSQQYPAVASKGTNYFVAWSDGRSSNVTPDLYGARVTSGGTVEDTNGVVISATANTQIYPALASNGTNYLAVYQSNSSGTNRIRANLITP